jgi:hypothetical protein
MKTIKKLFWIGGLACPAISLWLLNSSLAAPPGLSIAVSSSNQVSLTVTNAGTNFLYEIFFTEVLDPTATLTNGWTFLSAGTIGSSNFTARTDQTFTGFFRAIVGNDQDGDGIPDQQDARPFDPTIGILTVTIENPTNGATLH